MGGTSLRRRNRAKRTATPVSLVADLTLEPPEKPERAILAAELIAETMPLADDEAVVGGKRFRKDEGCPAAIYEISPSSRYFFSLFRIVRALMPSFCAASC